MTIYIVHINQTYMSKICERILMSIWVIAILLQYVLYMYLKVKVIS